MSCSFRTVLTNLPLFVERGLRKTHLIVPSPAIQRGSLFSIRTMLESWLPTVETRSSYTPCLPDEEQVAHYFRTIPHPECNGYGKKVVGFLL